MPIITISGFPGAGKTKLANNLSEMLNYEPILIGDLQGIIAQENYDGITINELMDRAKTDKTIHTAMDNKVTQLSKEDKNRIFEGWISYNFTEGKSYNIFVKVDEMVGAERIFNRQSSDELKYNSPEHARIETKKRFENSRKGFKNAHGIIFPEYDRFHSVIDTTHKTPEQVMHQAYTEFSKWVSKINLTKSQ